MNDRNHADTIVKMNSTNDSIFYLLQKNPLTIQDRWLKALNDALNLFTIRPLHWNVIDTNDIAEWFTQNDTYKFLKRHDRNEKVNTIAPFDRIH